MTNLINNFFRLKDIKTSELIRLIYKKLTPNQVQLSIYKSLYKIKCKPPLKSNKKKINEISNKLSAEGVCIIRNYFSKTYVNKIRSKVIKEFSKLEQTGKVAKGCKFYFNKDDPVSRIMNLHNVIPETKEFFFDSFLEEVMKATYSESLVKHQFMVDRRKGSAKTTATDCWHFDEPSSIFKLKTFLLLNDVTTKNGPFKYIPKTHKTGPWRNKKEAEQIAYAEDLDYGHYTPIHIKSLKRKFKFEEMVCTGKAGDLIIFDGSGIHSSSIIESGERYILSTYYEVPN